MCFRILTGVKNGLFTSWKIVNILLKNIPFEAFFQDEVNVMPIGYFFLII